MFPRLWMSLNVVDLYKVVSNSWRHRLWKGLRCQSLCYWCRQCVSRNGCWLNQPCLHFRIRATDPAWHFQSVDKMRGVGQCKGVWFNRLVIPDLSKRCSVLSWTPQFFKGESVLECPVHVGWKFVELQDVDGDIWGAFVVSSQETLANSNCCFLVSDIKKMVIKNLY